MRTLDLLNKYKINYHGNILVGFEDETASDIENELRTVPLKYSLYPAMVQPFIGTQNGIERKISEQEFKSFNHLFTAFAKAGGKTCYPQLEL